MTSQDDARVTFHADQSSAALRDGRISHEFHVFGDPAVVFGNGALLPSLMEPVLDQLVRAVQANGGGLPVCEHADGAESLIWWPMIESGRLMCQGCAFVLFDRYAEEYAAGLRTPVCASCGERLVTYQLLVAETESDGTVLDPHAVCCERCVTTAAQEAGVW